MALKSMLTKTRLAHIPHAVTRLFFACGYLLSVTGQTERETDRPIERERERETYRQTERLTLLGQHSPNR